MENVSFRDFFPVNGLIHFFFFYIFHYLVINDVVMIKKSSLEHICYLILNVLSEPEVNNV